jgi:hypothetical protein
MKSNMAHGLVRSGHNSNREMTLFLLLANLTILAIVIVVTWEEVITYRHVYTYSILICRI